MIENDTEKNDIPENYLGALDIGSNSFHFVFARIVNDNLQVLHSEKYRVKLADGLDDKFKLSDEAIERGLDALKGLAALTNKLSADNFKVVATYTLRQAKNAKSFLKAAIEVFPFDIEIISGHEEARLIFQGVSHNVVLNEKHLVLDIGGGSTECIIGKQNNIANLESLNIGCVSMARNYFANNKLTEKQFNKAILHAKMEIELILKRFHKTGWKSVIGTSGTIKSIFNIVNHQNTIAQPVTLNDLNSLKEQACQFESVEKLNFDGLKSSRKPIFASGLSIMIALMEMFEIDEFTYCEFALREGVLYELLDNIHCQDIRQRTINSLCSRFSIDAEQGNKVDKLSEELFHIIAKPWGLNKSYKKLIRWAAQLHEIGFDINTSGYQKHGSYILQHADLAGFNKEQQQALAWLVGNQRKKITILDDEYWYLIDSNKLIKTCAIFRLAILLSQQRQLTRLPLIKAIVDELQLTLSFPHQWLEERPLIKADLAIESEFIAVFNIKLSITTYR